MTPPLPVHVPALNLHGTLVGVVPPGTPGGVTRYLTQWHEAALNVTHTGGFWLEDFDDDTRARLTAVLNGVEAEAV